MYRFIINKKDKSINQNKKNIFILFLILILYFIQIIKSTVRAYTHNNNNNNNNLTLILLKQDLKIYNPCMIKNSK